MSTEQTPNPPAFPEVEHEQIKQVHGMTLRDYFAAKAIQIPVSYNPSSLWQWIKWSLGLPYNSNSRSHKANASEAYRLADAMLKERTKHQ